MRVSALLLLLVAGCATSFAKPGAVEMRAEGIALPFFDATGKPTHRLSAKRGAMTGTTQKLKEVELVYFSAKDPDVIVQKLVAADAVWDAKREVLTGEGPIEVVTEENTLSGEGFDFAFATSLLHIHRNFTMTNAEVRLTSDRATVELIVEQRGDEKKVRDVKRCDAIGNFHAVVQSTARQKYVFEEAWSTIASYEGATRIITFPEPMRYVAKGRLGEAKTMSIDLSPKAEPKN